MSSRRRANKTVDWAVVVAPDDVDSSAPGSRQAAGRADRLATLASALRSHRGKPAGHSRSAKLFAAGVPKMAQKLVEEAAEVAIEALRDERRLMVSEAADLLYNLTVLLTACDITIEDVWAEMDRRESILGLAEKPPKAS